MWFVLLFCRLSFHVALIVCKHATSDCSGEGEVFLQWCAPDACGSFHRELFVEGLRKRCVDFTFRCSGLAKAKPLKRKSWKDPTAGGFAEVMNSLRLEINSNLRIGDETVKLVAGGFSSSFEGPQQKDIPMCPLHEPDVTLFRSAGPK